LLRELGFALFEQPQARAHGFAGVAEAPRLNRSRKKRIRVFRKLNLARWHRALLFSSRISPSRDPLGRLAVKAVK
jgi:hypothetical protein